MILPIIATLAFQTPSWQPVPSLPRPVSNNAVAAVETSRGWEVYSLLGIDSTKGWNGTVNWAFRWNPSEAEWDEIAPVPGPGRLAGTAQGVRGRIYVFGGYTVAGDGSERSLPDVDIFDPETGAWRKGAPIPVPTDDAVSGVWRDSLIYLVSGWHDRANITNVQFYDPASDEWRQATPIPGPPVFGHAGSIVGNAIVYVDGVRVDENPRRFSAERSSWRGDIDPDDPTRITWRRIEDHPGPTLYRAGGGAAPDGVILLGGSDNPYNYDGVGYNGEPSRPLVGVYRYDVHNDRWEALGSLPRGVMDLRGIVLAGDRLIVIGGMLGGQRVTQTAWMAPFRAR